MCGIEGPKAAALCDELEVWIAKLANVTNSDTSNRCVKEIKYVIEGLEFLHKYIEELT